MPPIRTNLNPDTDTGSVVMHGITAVCSCSKPYWCAVRLSGFIPTCPVLLGTAQAALAGARLAVMQQLALGLHRLLRRLRRQRRLSWGGRRRRSRAAVGGLRRVAAGCDGVTARSQSITLVMCRHVKAQGMVALACDTRISKSKPAMHHLEHCVISRPISLSSRDCMVISVR